MAVNSNSSFDGHSPKHKIGVITSANISVGNAAIVIAGFIHAADFPEIASTIKAQKSVLGFSFEAQRITVLDPCADVLTITELTFTGAAILRKDKAAYTTTSLAASAAKIEGLDMTPEEIKSAIQAALAERAEIQSAQTDEMKKAVAAAVEAATKPLLDKIAAAETRAADAAARVRLKAAAPERKTIGGMEGRLARASIGDDDLQHITMKNGVALA